MILCRPPAREVSGGRRYFVFDVATVAALVRTDKERWRLSREEAMDMAWWLAMRYYTGGRAAPNATQF